MRISYDKNDPGYANRGWAVEIFLNGTRVVDVLTADEDAGLVVVFDRNDADELMSDSETGRLKTKTLKGWVVIRRPGEAHPAFNWDDDAYRRGADEGSIDLAGLWARDDGGVGC